MTDAAPRPGADPSDRLALGAIAIAFVVTRAIALLRLGPVDLDPARLGGWHAMDPVLLKHRLAETLLYLHAQPPLYNLVLGLILKACPGFESVCLQAVHTGLGAAVAWGLYRLMTALGVGRALAAGLVAAYLASPASMLYETLLSYDHPNMALLVLSAVALLRFARTRTLGAGLCFFSLVTALALLRPMFHLGWVVLVVAALALAARAWPAGAKRALALAVLPTLLVPALYVKNAVLFHHFAASTWMGMNLARITLIMVPPAERRALVAEGRLSSVAAGVPFRPLDEYPPGFRQAPPTGVPVLDERVVSTNGYPNFNNLAYIRLSDQFQRDDLAVVRARPGAYLKGLAWAALFYLQPAEKNEFLGPALARLEPWSGLYQRAAYGRLVPASFADRLGSPAVGRLVGAVGLWFVVAFPVLFALGWRRLRRAHRRDAPATRLVLAYMLSSIAFVTLVGNTLEAGENFRFRFLIDPFYLVLLGVAAQAAIARWRPSRDARLSSGEPSAGIEPQAAPAPNR